jgi:hypothetical protein
MGEGNVVGSFSKGEDGGGEICVPIFKEQKWGEGSFLLSTEASF